MKALVSVSLLFPMMKLFVFLLALEVSCGKRSKSSSSSSCTQDFAFHPTEKSTTFLKSILNPLSLEDFFLNHFQKKAASAQRPGLPGYYGPMATFEHVEHAIENGYHASSPSRRLIYGKDWKLAKRVFQDGDYWTGLFSGSKDGEMDVEEALKAFSKGFTLIMNGVQSSLPNVYQGAWQLETALGWHVNVNLYVSPPGGSQGFEAHLDWMDGFIFQLAGKKRWKVYEPALVSYPRPDMVRKPPLSFFEMDSVESDLVLHAGDFAYIPRGVVHQAHTSAEDYNGDDSDPYQQPSMHLTYGIELAKDASVEMLLHHFVSKVPSSAFSQLSEALSASKEEPKDSIVFSSDNGKIAFMCSPRGSSDLESGISTPDTDDAHCTQRDIIHLLLSAAAGYVSAEEEAYVKDHLFEPNETISTAMLRKAVGVTNFTSGIESLDPRILLPRGLEVFSEAIESLGMQHLLKFLLEKKMLSVSQMPKVETCEGDAGKSVDSALRAAVSALKGMDKSAEVDSLQPPSTSLQNYTTLGSDFSCKYIDPFLSGSFKTKASRLLDLKVQFTDEISWERLSKIDPSSKSRMYDIELMNSILVQDSWQNVEKEVAGFVLSLSRFLKSPETGDSKSGLKAYTEGETYCKAWKSMMDVLSSDKSVRKKSGLQALQNAGYRMNAI